MSAPRDHGRPVASGDQAGSPARLTLADAPPPDTETVRAILALLHAPMPSFRKEAA